MPGWIWALLGALAVFFVLRRFVGRADPVDAWRQLAEGLGLRYEPGGAAGPNVRGRYRDVEVRISSERPPGAPPGAPASALVQAEIPLPGTVGVWGAASQRLTDGSDPWSRPGRDAMALLRLHNSKSVVQALARPEVMEHARVFLAQHERARIADDWVTLEEPGPHRDARKLHRLLDEVASMARAFRETPGVEPSDSAPSRKPPVAEDPWAAMGPGAGTAGGAWDSRAGAPEEDEEPPHPEQGANPYAPPAGPGATSRPFEPPFPMAPPRADPEMASRWKRRTAVAYLLGLLPSGLGACLAIFGGAMAGKELYGIDALYWVGIGGAIFGLGLLLFMSSYHCPKCGRFIRSPRSGRIVFDPEHCPHCATRLRDPNRPPTPPNQRPR